MRLRPTTAAGFVYGGIFLYCAAVWIGFVYAISALIGALS